MRAGWLGIGVVLLILGAVLAFVPIVTSATGTVDALDPMVFNVTAAFSLTGTIPLEIDWSSSQTVTIEVVTCSSINNLNCQDESNSTQTGTSGAFHVAPKTNGAVGVVLNGLGSASVTVKEAQTTLGAILLVLGVLLLIVGLVLKKKARPMPIGAPPTPT